MCGNFCFTFLVLEFSQFVILGSFLILILIFVGCTCSNCPFSVLVYGCESQKRQQRNHKQ